MADDGFNMSMRKYLKRVGVTSQQAIEEAVRDARDRGELPASIPVRIELTAPTLNVTHVVEGEIEPPEGS